MRFAKLDIFDRVENMTYIIFNVFKNYEYIGLSIYFNWFQNIIYFLNSKIINHS